LTKRTTTITIWRNTVAEKIERSSAPGSTVSGRTRRIGRWLRNRQLADL
jgi:hypothetical protein